MSLCFHEVSEKSPKHFFKMLEDLAVVQMGSSEIAKSSPPTADPQGTIMSAHEIPLIFPLHVPPSVGIIPKDIGYWVRVQVQRKANLCLPEEAGNLLFGPCEKGGERHWVSQFSCLSRARAGHSANMWRDSFSPSK